MRRSRLEKYVSILEALVPQPEKLEKISFATNIECLALKRHMDFMISHKLVKERATKEKIVYAISDRGVDVFKSLQAREYLKKLRRVLPLLEEARKSNP